MVATGPADLLTPPGRPSARAGAGHWRSRLRPGAAPAAAALVAGGFWLAIRTLDYSRAEATLLTLAILLAGVAGALAMRWWLRQAGAAVLDPRAARLPEQRAGVAELVASLAAERDRAERARVEAEDASQAKSYFLATMSHELRTPLNAILGFSEIMKERLPGLDTLDTYRQYSRHIFDSGTHLMAVINDILDLAKVESGRLELSEEEAELKQLIRGVAQLMTNTATRRQIGIVLRLDPAPAELRLDVRLCKQMLFNLLSNAVKFTGPGGTVTVDLGRAEGGVRVSVSDTGPGIAPGDMDRVMQPFVQGATARTTPARGTGLGLPLVKAYIEAHGGRFTLDSRLGQGTCATLWFPPERLVARDGEAGLRSLG